MKYPLKNFTIAVTGDFGESRGHDKMKQWITRNGGKFTVDISPKVTHLICSKEHYKKAVTMVKQAHFLKTVHIVSFDWLEDSLMRGRPRNERDYLMGPRVKAEAATKAKKKKARKDNIKKGMEAFEKSIKDFENDMNSSGYGIYHDPLDNFPYDITLVRPSLLENTNERYRLKVCSTTLSPQPPPKPLYIPPHRRVLIAHHPKNSVTSCTSPPSNSNINSNPNPNPILSTPLLPIAPPPPLARAPLTNPRAQRLQLYVTHSVPKYYSCYVKYSAPNTPPVPEMLAPIGSGWETAWGVFQGFFRLKTGREWAERDGGVWGMRGSYVEPSGERLFEYNVPPMGQPRGAVGAVDHEAVLEREVERLRGLGVSVGEEWGRSEDQDEGNGGVQIGAGEECSARDGRAGGEQERMGPGEYETRMALEGVPRQLVGLGQGTGQQEGTGVGEYETQIALGGVRRQEVTRQEPGQRASPGQNVMGFRNHEEHNEAQMKTKTEHAKMFQKEKYAKAREDVVKLLETDNEAGRDGKHVFIKPKPAFAKTKEGEVDTQARGKKLKPLDAYRKTKEGEVDAQARGKKVKPLDADGQNEIREFEENSRGVLRHFDAAETLANMHYDRR